VDDHIWTEVKNFTKCMVQMWAARGQSCIFMESAVHVRRCGVASGQGDLWLQIRRNGMLL
jgi:hypothetical protein